MGNLQHNCWVSRSIDPRKLDWLLACMTPCMIILASWMCVCIVLLAYASVWTPLNDDPDIEFIALTKDLNVTRFADLDVECWASNAGGIWCRERAVQNPYTCQPQNVPSKAVHKYGPKQ